MPSPPPQAGTEIPEEVIRTAQIIEQAKPPSPEEETAINKRLNRKFADKNNEVKSLLAAMDKTIAKLSAIGASGNLDEKEREFVERSIDWLESQKTHFSETIRPRIEVMTMSEYIKQLIRNIEQLLERNDGTSRILPSMEITEIYARTEAILQKFPEVIMAIMDEQIEINQSIINSYLV